MKVARIDDCILALGNNQGDLDALQQIFKPTCPRFVAESHEDHFIAAWRRYRPAVLILCFDPIELAKTAYLGLLRKAHDGAPSNHQTLLLCNAHDMREACALAMEELVDDFAVFKPLQLPELLLLKVRQAVAKAQNAIGMERVATLLQGSATSFESVKDLWTDLLAKGELSQHTIERESTDFLNSMQSIATEGYSDGAQKRLGELEQGAHQFANGVGKAVGSIVQELRDGLTSTLEPAAGQIFKDARAAINVAIVDDEADVRRALANMAQAQGFTAFACDSGQSLLALGSRQRLDIVLMDINLPGVNGVEVTSQLKTHPRFKDVPFIMVSGLAYQDIVRRCRAVGATQFLVKPVDSATLANKINAVLKRY